MVIVTATTFQLAETSFPLSRLCEEGTVLDRVYRQRTLTSGPHRSTPHATYTPAESHARARAVTREYIHKHVTRFDGTRYLSGGVGRVYLCDGIRRANLEFARAPELLLRLRRSRDA